MSAPIAIEGLSHIPARPTFVIPNRVDIGALRSLEEALGGLGKITWLVEQTLRPGAEIMSYMQKQNARGILFRAAAEENKPLHGKIEAELVAGRHVVLLPGRPAQPAACHADVPADVLHDVLAAYPHAVLPVYLGMYHVKKEPFVTSQAPWERQMLHIMPLVRAEAGAADGVLAAWLEAGARQAGQLAATMGGSLPQALLRSLLAHSHAVVIDGVNDTRMSYRHLLFLAAPLARHLRKHMTSRRLGIILPPGKLAIIANVACILAGISPVNIDYTYDRAQLDQVVRQAGLTRFITERCFIDMQQRFAWPRQRDILFIDEALAPSGYGLLSRWSVLSRWFTPGRIAKWIRTPSAAAQDEALAVYTPAEEGAEMRGASLSHMAVLAGAALCASRICPKGGGRTLSALPYHRHAGLLLGLIYPLLAGRDIITYPLPSAGKRLGSLARQYKPTGAVFTADQARKVLEHARQEDFEHMPCLYIIGSVPAELAERVFAERRLALCECYMPLEAAMPVACNMPPPEAGPAEASRHVTSGGPDAAGLVLPGMAIRITDMERPDSPLPLSRPGLVWVKGPALASGSPGHEKAALHAYDRWRCTGDVGYVRQDGLLAIGGARSRFSKVRGSIVSHAAVERLMVKFMKIDVADSTPRLAIVGLPDAQNGGEQLVLLSAVHKVVGPHDVITLRYDLKNARYPELWAPAHIVALRAIPTLPSGQIDYALCRALAQKGMTK